MHWTVRLDARTSQGEVKTTELVTFSRPGMVSTLAEIGLVRAGTKTLLAKLQASMLCGQVAAYAAHRRVCTACRASEAAQGPARAPIADAVRHGRGRGAAVQGLPLPPAGAAASRVGPRTPTC